MIYCFLEQLSRVQTDHGALAVTQTLWLTLQQYKTKQSFSSKNTKLITHCFNYDVTHVVDIPLQKSLVFVLKFVSAALSAILHLSV